MVDQLVSPEAQANGDYRSVDFVVTEGEFGSQVKGKMRVVRNLASTPIDRWHANGGLDDRQMAAILFYTRAWHLVFQQPRVVAKWSAVHTAGAAGALEVYASTRLGAMESLRLIDNDIFFRLPVEHFQVFQNVVIFDEAAGVAGGRAGFTHKAAEGAARAIVAMVASMIADLVIDGARDSFSSDLLRLIR